jgi:hypothetical protein
LWKRTGELSATLEAEARVVLPKRRAMKVEACILMVVKWFA